MQRGRDRGECGSVSWTCVIVLIYLFKTSITCFFGTPRPVLRTPRSARAPRSAASVGERPVVGPPSLARSPCSTCVSVDPPQPDPSRPASLGQPFCLQPRSTQARSRLHATAGHAPTSRQATHTNTLSEKGGDAHWSEITARSHRVLLKVGAAPDAFCPEPHDFSKLAGLRSTDSPVSSSLIVKRAFFASYAVASPHVPLSSGRPCSPYMRRRLPNLDM